MTNQEKFEIVEQMRKQYIELLDEFKFKEASELWDRMAKINNSIKI